MKYLPPVNLSFGKRLREILTEKGFPKKDMYKRYLLKEFHNVYTFTGSIDNAFQVFEAITEDDKASMYENKKIKEDKVKDVIEKIKNRLEIN